MVQHQSGLKAYDYLMKAKSVMYGGMIKILKVREAWVA